MPALTCLGCDRVNPPPTESCKDGKDHTFRNGPGVCPECNRLVKACRNRECTWRRKQNARG